MDKKALYTLSYGLYVVSVKNGNNFGGCVVDAFIQSTGVPPTVILCSIQKNKTNECIKETNEFCISVLPSDVDYDVISNFGMQSSRDVDKWAKVNYETEFGYPVIKNACAYIKCKVINQVELSTHTAFVCEVEDALKGEGEEPIIYADYLSKKRKQKETKSSSSKPEYVCTVCGYIYDGDIPFEQLPDDYVCPICKQPKSVFEKR